MCYLLSVEQLVTVEDIIVLISYKHVSLWWICLDPHLTTSFNYKCSIKKCQLKKIPIHLKTFGHNVGTHNSTTKFVGWIRPRIIFAFVITDQGH